MKTIRTFLRTSSILAMAACSLQAAAGNVSDDISVTARVVSSCSMSATDIAFGNYDPIVANATTPIDRTSTVTTTCTIGSTPTINIGAASDDNANRSMMNGVEPLAYGLFSDAGRTTGWPEAGATGVAVTTPSGTAETNTIYARLPAGQYTVPVGNYAETVTVVVTF